MWSSPRRGEVSWLCDAGHHARCTGIVANWNHMSGGVVLRPCGCRTCRHTPDLTAAAEDLLARTE